MHNHSPEKATKRVGKGMGIISNIMNILEKVTLGEHYFSTAILLRDSLFINSILTNANIWYGMTKSEMKELSDLDSLLLRKILNPIRVGVFKMAKKVF